MSRSLVPTLFMALAFACEIQAQSVAEARASMRAGEYEEAVTSFTRLLREDESSVDARRGLVQALRITGRYAEAEATASRAPNQVMLANILDTERSWLSGTDGDYARQSVMGGGFNFPVGEAGRSCELRIPAWVPGSAGSRIQLAREAKFS